MEEIIKNAQELLTKNPMISLATITADGKPWVRFVMARVDEDLTIRIATSATSRKVEQIRANPEVHITGGVSSLPEARAYVQISGRAEISTDPHLKKVFWTDQLKAYFSGPEDDKYAVVVVTPYRVEHQPMTAMKPEVWERP